MVDRSKRFKILVIGEPRVGKTTLINKYVKVEILREYMPTVGASISKQPVTVQNDGKEEDVHLLIWDIGGQKRFSNLHNVYFNGAKGVIIVFDLTRPDTLEKVKLWYSMVNKYFGEKLPQIILVGNKSDLTDEIEVDKGKIDQTTMLLGIDDYFQTSALMGDQVTEVFSRMAEKLYL